MILKSLSLSVKSICFIRILNSLFIYNYLFYTCFFTTYYSNKINAGIIYLQNCFITIRCCFINEKTTEKYGSFSLDEMLKMTFAPETIVWREGFENWKNIMEVDSLKLNIRALEKTVHPPKTPAETNRVYRVKKIKIGLAYTILLSIIIFIITLIIHPLNPWEKSIPYFVGRYLFYFAVSIPFGFSIGSVVNKDGSKDKVDFITVLLLAFGSVVFIAYLFS
jgi:hypothetical protein